ncbi:sulfite exporter TauE/SafE family protein [Thalassotalea profundi]|uniref:Cytochrome biogenesis protein n=1 Tax=Thalassotalea profundi TaxID=2036687 RepID=A0ABQ3IGR8_9GAMM|nr:sulfite exporter TauE/SafE family protein [Thalassotalea profundi]GHE83982.1 cytochrome biogenesis protein [Thalassotalea profundi]
MEIDFFAAFVIGILGSGHCIAMCGGITTMLSSAVNKETNASNKLSIILSYNLGRIATYSLIGAIAGLTGSLAAKNIGFPVSILRMIAGVFLILLGLYIGRWFMLLNKVEQLGKGIWKYLSPLSKKFIPIEKPKQALALGAIWGWLPCGLVYSTLTWSLASGSLLSGAIIMFFFGLGTLPALMTLSFGAISIKSVLLNNNFRKIMALLLIIYGIVTLKFASDMMF